MLTKNETIVFSANSSALALFFLFTSGSVFVDALGELERLVVVLAVMGALDAMLMERWNWSESMGTWMISFFLAAVASTMFLHYKGMYLDPAEVTVILVLGPLLLGVFFGAIAYLPGELALALNRRTGRRISSSEGPRPSVQEEPVIEEDPFSVLGLPISASEAEVKERFATLAKIYHPDTSGNPASARQFVRIKDAYDEITRSAN